MYAYPGAEELTVLDMGFQQDTTDNGQMLCVHVQIRAIEDTRFYSFDFKVVGAEDSPQYEMPYWSKEMRAGATSVEASCFSIGQDDSPQFFLLWNPAVTDPRYFSLQ